MIYGNVNNEFFEQQAAMLPKPLGDALRFLKTADLINHEAGRFPMDLNGVDVILQVMDLQTKPREAAKPEIHRKYIDVQFLVCGGPEKAACYSDDGSGAVSSDELATERDILFYENNPDALESTVYLTPGAYAIYLPWDVHVPGLSADGQARAFRKIVMKVPMAACV
jgi:YhcH/YjgK/YiaL family protein